jgi:hypothetical protein
MKGFDTIRDEGRKAHEDTLNEEMSTLLNEALVVLGKGKKYGQAVILAGGAGSGKGFAVTHLLQGELYKVINPDDFKDLLLKVRDKKTQVGSERLGQVLKDISDLDLKNPKDTSTLHMLVRGMNLMQKKITYLFAGKGGAMQMPNVMFDVTMKDPETLFGDASEEGILTQLKNAGYKRDDIHIVWILTDYKIAMQQNLSRDRVVNSHIVLQSHAGAAKTMQEVVFKNYGKMGINGDVVVIIGGSKGGSITYTKGSEIEDKYGKVYTLDRDLKVPVFAKINYFRIKNAGSAQMSRDGLVAVQNYIGKLAPPPKLDFENDPEGASKFVKRKEKQAVMALARSPKGIDPKVARNLGYRGL